VTPAGAVQQPLRANLENDRVRLSGVFGVFHRGHAQATFFDSLGNVLARRDLGPVDPARVFQLGAELLLPKAAGRVSLCILDEDGENRGWLGNFILPRERTSPPPPKRP
jgi:hypothetical protein